MVSFVRPRLRTAALAALASVVGLVIPAAPAAASGPKLTVPRADLRAALDV